MDKSGITCLSDFAFELSKVTDTLIAIEVAYDAAGVNFPKALMLPTERLKELCEIVQEMSRKEEGVGAGGKYRTT